MSKFCVVPIIFRVVEWCKALDGEPPLNVAGSNPTINIHIHNHQHHIITSHTIPTITYILPQSHNHSPTSSSQSSLSTTTNTTTTTTNTTYIYISSIYCGRVRNRMCGSSSRNSWSSRRKQRQQKAIRIEMKEQWIVRRLIDIRKGTVKVHWYFAN